MCLMVYVGTREPPTTVDPAVLGFDEVDPARAAVRQWFSLPCVRHVGVPAGNCSCAFRSVLAEEPVEWYEGMWAEEDAEKRATNAAVTNSLRQLVTGQGVAELYAIWDGNEGARPACNEIRDLSWFDPESFFVQENWFYRLSAAPVAS